ncbi:MAG: ATP synthase F1 subunit epsilon [Deltaproteobacteria bacterium]|jgi:F-type H+-transporting ATPase subunit epsilon|nr:ATP synthase F1 subunit epsilon [Deltaproteobacteria bacterium]
MSAREFKLTVVTPDKRFLWETPALAVGAIGSEGAFTALPGHVPFLTDLKAGRVWYRDPAGQEDSFLVTGGFVEVLPEEVTILADSAERYDEIDAERAERAQRRAEQRLRDAKNFLGARPQEAKVQVSPEEEERLKKERMELVRAEAALQRATARMKAARERSKYPHKKK